MWDFVVNHIGVENVILAVIAGWSFYNSKYWPAKEKRLEQEHADSVEASRDDKKFLQKSQGDALQVQQDITKLLIENNLKLVNGKFESITQTQIEILELARNELKSIRKDVDVLPVYSRRMENIETATRTVVTDWSRMNEILSDIDISLTTLQEMKEEIKLLREAIAELPHD